jgi:ribosomal protein L28
MTSVSRSHSHIATKRRQNVNLQVRRIDGAKELVCAACIKASKKTVK